MAYRYGERSQMALFTQSIEEYIPADSPVRAYDAFVDALDFNELGIYLDSHKVGNSEYYPKAMLKLLVYGYSYGLKGSRKLERETYYNLSFIWLMGGMKPDHKTISEFRRKNKKALKKVLKQCARLCIELNLIEGNVLFVDGTKIRANAARHRTHDKAWYENRLAELDQRIEQLLNECDTIDQQEQHLGSFVSMDKELSKTKRLKNKVQKVLEEFKKTDRKKINRTDTGCSIMKSVQGSHASYNVQSVVDDKNGLIVNVEAVNDTSDIHQFARQVHNEEIKEKLEAQFEEPASKDIYSKRKTRVEHPFGHIKRNLKTDSFMLRGNRGVQAEISLLASCFNISRMITLLGVPGLIQKLSTKRAVYV